MSPRTKIAPVVLPNGANFWYNMGLMRNVLSFLAVLAAACAAEASWYWPFGGDDQEKMRLSTLMEPASKAMDRANDFIADGKIDEAVEAYREALREIDRIEAENPERAKTQEFVSVRNKRVMASTAIDSLLLKQARDNARPVAVTDTSALEKKLAAERRGKAELAEAAVNMARKDRLKLILKYISEGAHSAAEAHINRLLDESSKDAAAWNLKASVKLAEGDFKVAEAVLLNAIEYIPDGYHAHYNLARLKLKQSAPDPAAARDAYEAGRLKGGPVDSALEIALAEAEAASANAQTEVAP